MAPNFLSINNKNTSKLQTGERGSHPYQSQNSQASSSVSLQDLRYSSNTHSSSGEQDEELPEPVLPWMKSESRQSLGGNNGSVVSSSRNSVDTTSLHIVKRYAPDPAIKKKQRWTSHKWWLLLSNTLVSFEISRVLRLL